MNRQTLLMGRLLKKTTRWLLIVFVREKNNFLSKFTNRNKWNFPLVWSLKIFDTFSLSLVQDLLRSNLSLTKGLRLGSSLLGESFIYSKKFRELKFDHWDILVLIGDHLGKRPLRTTISCLLPGNEFIRLIFSREAKMLELKQETIMPDSTKCFWQV